MYEVIDRKTEKVLGTYKNRKTASRAVDRLDNIYGGYRYFYRMVKTNKINELINEQVPN